MPPAEVISVIATSLWFIVVLAQLGRIASAVIDAGSGSTPAARESARYLTWVLPATVLLCIPLGAGILASWTIAVGGAVVPGALLALAVVMAALAVVGVAARVVSRRPTLSSFLDELRGYRGERVHPDVIDVLRERYAVLTADHSARWHPETVVSRRRHLLPVLAGVAAVVTIGIADNGGPILVAALALPAVNLVASLVSIRTTRTALTARRVVDARTMDEIARLLEELGRLSRRGIAGLAERVALALRTLREQQAPGR